MSAKTGVAVHASNPTLQEAKAGGLWVHGQAGLQSDTLSQKKKKKVCKVVMSLKHKQNIIAIILHQLHATVSSVEEVNWSSMT
jgi:4-hydroxy-L-threonine phosphate dehydrogenase PdxA